ncbi:MAG: hypothetical protein GY842_04320 [bacterium]|nr:hypothetical protein [bacterium]
MIITLAFSESVTDVAFEISDIDWSAAGGGQNSRLDQVVITSDTASPLTLGYKTGTPTFTIAGNTATAINLSSSSADEDGTVQVSFTSAVNTVTVTYNEASGNSNPAGRGIGLFFMLTETPVELMSFSIE